MSATDIASGIDASQSYVSKVLSRMAKTGILKSNIDGYELIGQTANMTANNILKICHAPSQNGPASILTTKLLELSKQIPLVDLL